MNDAAHPSTTRKPHLPALTGLRALLALGILFFHFTPPHVQLIAPIIDTAYAFVAVFFLLSGYVLAYNYADRAAPLNKRNFWQARFARLYPVYLLALILSLPMLQAEWFARSRSDFFAGLILTPLLLQGWSPTLATFWNTVAWALSAELLLYLSFPWLIRLPWPKSTTRLVELLLAIWIIGLLPHTFYLLLNPDHLTVPANRYSYGYWLRWIKFSPIIYAATFVIGVGLGKLQLALTLTTRQQPLRPDRSARTRCLLSRSNSLRPLCSAAWRRHDAALRALDPRSQWEKLHLVTLLAASPHDPRRGQLLPLPSPLQFSEPPASTPRLRPP